ncbi:uncharacterized protein BJ171DRAFT_474142 [Polychytrium aggregatum]|uniref:uncharacterized protein n=1 Tax=Polychytrium aggregatum TaxID=110093 RepID=UPI0022FEA81F|nr:uncharacterized protein BJ171DRAFT_474142 [Polychytrium aggregatum]KAI9205650.1 hypothetical protein BJ171DRAFT_474142 [Polychytrium aggregatum]
MDPSARHDSGAIAESHETVLAQISTVELLGSAYQSYGNQYSYPQSGMSLLDLDQADEADGAAVGSSELSLRVSDVSMVDDALQILAKPSSPPLLPDSNKHPVAVAQNLSSETLCSSDLVESAPSVACSETEPSDLLEPLDGEASVSDLPPSILVGLSTAELLGGGFRSDSFAYPRASDSISLLGLQDVSKPAHPVSMSCSSASSAVSSPVPTPAAPTEPVDGLAAVAMHPAQLSRLDGISTVELMGPAYQSFGGSFAYPNPGTLSLLDLSLDIDSKPDSESEELADDSTVAVVSRVCDLSTVELLGKSYQSYGNQFSYPQPGSLPLLSLDLDLSLSLGAMSPDQPDATELACDATPSHNLAPRDLSNEHGEPSLCEPRSSLPSSSELVSASSPSLLANESLIRNLSTVELLGAAYQSYGSTYTYPQHGSHSLLSIDQLGDVEVLDSTVEAAPERPTVHVAIEEPDRELDLSTAPSFEHSNLLKSPDSDLNPSQLLNISTVELLGAAYRSTNSSFAYPKAATSESILNLDRALGDEAALVAPEAAPVSGPGATLPPSIHSDTYPVQAMPDEPANPHSKILDLSTIELLGSHYQSYGNSFSYPQPGQFPLLALGAAAEAPAVSGVADSVHDSALALGDQSSQLRGSEESIVDIISSEVNLKAAPAASAPSPNPSLGRLALGMSTIELLGPAYQSYGSQFSYPQAGASLLSLEPKPPKSPSAGSAVSKDRHGGVDAGKTYESPSKVWWANLYSIGLSKFRQPLNSSRVTPLLRDDATLTQLSTYMDSVDGLESSGDDLSNDTSKTLPIPLSGPPSLGEDKSQCAVM